MKRLSDDIGEKYSEWKNGDCIFISAPTGSGKTYFVLNVLRPFLIQNNQKALYLVNRHILKDQIEKEMGRIQLKTGDIRNPIEVKTYQSIEKRIYSSEYREEENVTYKGFVGNEIYKDYAEYRYVVCDECHYFLSDLNYNANTALSFRFIQEVFDEKIRIFMSATIGDIREYIKKDNWQRYTSEYDRCTPFYKFCPDHVIYRNGFYDVANNSDGYDGKYRYYGDKLERDYEYLDVNIVKSHDEIINLIRNREIKGKWLVFVDSIKLGEKLEKELKKGDDVNGEKVVFVNSWYKDDAESLNEMAQITDRDMQSARVLIATAVLDNGINLKDIELRNMVIMADTETEFIQMLGRKRVDGELLKLYIYKQDKNTFVRRREQAARRIQIVKEYLEEFYELIQRDLDEKRFLPDSIKWERYEKTEWRLIKENHIRVMRHIAEGRIRYEDARSVFCTYGGILYVNLLAYENLQILYSHYENIIERIDEDGDDAFVKEQLSWLGLTEEEVNDVLRGEIEGCRLRVIKAFEEQVEKSPVSENDFKEFKLTIKDDLILLLGQVVEIDKEHKTVEGAIKKGKDRVISSKNMDYLRNNCNIPFIVNPNGNGTYTVERVIENIDNQLEIDVQ